MKAVAGEGFALVLIAADDYPDPPGRLPSSRSAARLAGLLEPCGARIAINAVVTSASEVRQALNGWARHKASMLTSSFVYLAGHGTSDGLRHWFVLPNTEDGSRPNTDDAVGTEALEGSLGDDWTFRQRDESSWTVLVLDCCAANIGVNALTHALTRVGFNRPKRLLVWPVTPEGASHSGRFVDEVERCLATFTENDQRITFEELVRRVGAGLGDLEPFGRLPESVALRNPLWTGGLVTMAADAYAELRRVVDEVPAAVRTHFLAKAQGVEVGTLAWYFCGRRAELATLARWLREVPGGLKVVTGDPGAGKSAILGQLVVLADEELVAALDRVGLMPDPGSEQRPPVGVFNAVEHLTGMTLTTVVGSLVAALRIAVPEDAEVDVDFLLDELRSADRGPITILADALDEAAEPLRIAELLRLVAQTNGVRVVVGTRRSLREGPDEVVDPARRELIDALAPGDRDLLEIGRDPTASTEYLTRRLLADRSSYTGRPDIVHAIAEAVAAEDQPFLFTHLAAFELLARPPFGPEDPALNAFQLVSAGEDKGLYGVDQGGRSAGA